MKAQSKQALGILAMHLKKVPQKYVLFLGSGASISSGYPSGQELVDYLLEELYYHIEAIHLKDSNNLMNWFEKEFGKSPSLGNLMEEMVPKLGEESIADLIKPYFENKEISSGYYRLAELIQEGYFHIVFNMNFDHALESALMEQGIIPNVIVTAGDCGTGMPEFPKKPMIVKIHGDIEKPRTLKASAQQTEELPTWMSSLLRSYLERLPFIFVGYSAQDADILRILNSIKKKDYRIFWISPGKQPSENTKSILSHFCSETNHIPLSFDDFFEKLHERLCKRDFESFFRESGYDYVLRKRHEVFVPPPGVEKARKILESENLLIITGEPHTGKSTLGEELLFDMFLNGYSVREFDAEKTPLSTIMERVATTERGAFLLDDPFGAKDLTNPVFGNRLFDLLRLSRESKVIITTRKSAFKKVLRKTKISERIPGIEKHVFEIKEYPENSLIKILENHLDYRKILAKQRVMKKKDLIISRLCFPHNIDYFVDILPEGVEESELSKFAQKAERIKKAKKEEFRLLEDAEKFALWILSATIEIEVEEWKRLHVSLMEDFGYEKAEFSHVREELEDWLRYRKEESFGESKYYVRFYHDSYFFATFEELLRAKEFLGKIYLRLSQFEDLEAKRLLPFTITYNLKEMPSEVVNLLPKLWNDKDSYVGANTGICLVDKYNELPEHLKEFLRENFLRELFLRDPVLAHMIERYDDLPEILEELLIKALDYDPKSLECSRTKAEESMPDIKSYRLEMDQLISDLGFELPDRNSDSLILDDLRVDEMLVVRFRLGPLTMGSLIRHYEDLPQKIKRRVVDFSESKTIAIRGELANGILENYEILPNDLQNLVPKILMDEKIKSRIGASIVSNYERLPEDIREDLFVIWERSTLDEKEDILGTLVHRYDELPDNVQRLIEDIPREGNERLILCICWNLFLFYDQISDPKKSLLTRCMSRLIQGPLIKSEDGDFGKCSALKSWTIMKEKGYVFKSSVIMRIFWNWERYPRLFQDYAANNWKELEGMPMDDFFKSLFEKHDVFPELAENILYESLTGKDIDVATSAVSEAIKNYSKLSFEIAQIMPSVIERIKTDKNLFSLSCHELRTSIIDNWDELPEDIRGFVFLKREARDFIELSGEIRFLEYMFENYEKFPGRAKEYLKDLLESTREKVRNYIITNIFDKVSKSSYSGDLFSCLEGNLETRIFVNNLMVANYRGIDRSLKRLIFAAARDKNTKVRYNLAISIVDVYDDVPRAIQDLALEISKNLPPKERKKISEYMRNTLKKTEG